MWGNAQEEKTWENRKSARCWTCTGLRLQMETSKWSTTYTTTMCSVNTRNQASESLGVVICRPCGVIIPESRPASTLGEFSGTGISGSRNSNHVPGTTSIHSEHYGIPQRQGRARDTVFRGSLRGAGLAEAMGPADRVTPHLGSGHADRPRTTSWDRLELTVTCDEGAETGGTWREGWK